MRLGALPLWLLVASAPLLLGADAAPTGDPLAGTVADLLQKSALAALVLLLVFEILIPRGRLTDQKLATTDALGLARAATETIKEQTAAFKDMKDAFVAQRSELVSLRGDIGTLRTELGVARAELAVIRAEVGK